MGQVNSWFVFHNIITSVEVKQAKQIVAFIGGAVLEGLLINELLKLIQAGLGKYMLEVGLLVAGIIGVAYFVFRLLNS